MAYLDVKEWHIPSVQQLSESKKRSLDCLMSSAQSFYGLCLWSVAHLFAVFLGMCHSSTCPGNHCTWLSFTRPRPALVLQATNTGVRRPGYEASIWPLILPGVCYFHRAIYISLSISFKKSVEDRRKSRRRGWTRPGWGPGLLVG